MYLLSSTAFKRVVLLTCLRLMLLDELPMTKKISSLTFYFKIKARKERQKYVHTFFNLLKVLSGNSMAQPKKKVF